MEVDKNPTPIESSNKSEFYLGLTLALCSSIFIGSSFIIKKISLIRLSKRDCIRAGAGGFGYLFDWLWWTGILTMGIGELSNFVAYAFAPASLVTPLGALSILVSAILASKILNERMSLMGKLGCVLCILGSTILVIHSPREDLVVTIEDLLNQAQNMAFIHYSITILIINILIFFFVGPKYGEKNAIIYLLLCSTIGSFTVIACKGLGIAIKENSVTPYEEQNYLVPFILFLVLASCLCIQVNYLNKALDLFSASTVTPIYYVLFTTFVIIATAILFEEWKHMSPIDILGAVCGFLVTVVAIFLLNFFKDVSALPSHQYGSIVSFQNRSV